MSTLKKYQIDFLGKFPITSIISFLLVAASVFLIWQKGLNYGVDFLGGAEIQVKISKDITGVELRKDLESKNVSASSVQTIGEEGNHDFLIKLQTTDENVNQVTDTAIRTLGDLYGSEAEVRKTDIVGPKAGAQLRLSGFLAMLWALLGIMIYIGLRFDFKYSPGAIIALFHDVTIILGVFALTEKEFSLQIVGALLAVIGYSVNDTVVVFDRVREHTEGGPIAKILNKALNETLTRTVLTSITTLMVSFIMFAMGAGVIQDFFFAITLGVVIGTYSSLFVAAPVTILFERILEKSSSKVAAKA